MAGSILVAAALLASAVFADPAPRPPSVIVGGQEQKYLTTPDGAPLYVFEGEGDIQECRDDCAREWPPLMAGQDEAGIGEWRPQLVTEDQYQWFFRGRPVHSGRRGRAVPVVMPSVGGGRLLALRYSGGGPAIAVPAAVGVRGLEQGYALTDARGLTLYSSASGECSGPCRDRWRPLRAPAAAMPVGEWTIMERSDAIRQWAWRGRAAFAFAGDEVPGATNGLNEPGDWHILGVSARDARSKRKGSTQ